MNPALDFRGIRLFYILVTCYNNKKLLYAIFSQDICNLGIVRCFDE